MASRTGPVKKMLGKKRPAKKAGNKPPKPGSKDFAMLVAAEASANATRTNGEAPKARRRIGTAPEPEEAPHGAYFASGNEKAGLRFVSTGCSVLDEALGGGFALGRVVNVVGDRSAGKTLLATEVAANFAAAYPKAPIRYAESEAAFDKPYAAALGMPLDRIDFNGWDTPKGDTDLPMQTVEDLYDDLERWLEANKKAKQGLYIIDSLDALSDDAEMDADFNKASFGGAKPKAIGQLFRRLVQRLEDQGVLFIVISQIREKLNAMPFGETKTRSGGKALDFYATHIVWLIQKGKIKQTIQKIERVVGVDVMADVRKNKVGLPFRKADYAILFGYGIDDLRASVDWLVKNGRSHMLKEVGMSQAGADLLITKARNEGGEMARELRAKLATLVRREWAIVEVTFLPKASKY